ncbi:alpha-glucosidase C-terminal domain-containing protein [bacterium]|nr:alpha-glucosidase C-terminal domain-containing protein [bacterium]
MFNNILKKLYFILLASTFLIGTNAFSQEVSEHNINIVQSAKIDNQIIEDIDPHIKKELKISIQSVYGEDRTEEIYNKLIMHAASARENRPQKLKQQDLIRNSDWFKDEIIYMFYVNQFGVVQNNKDNTFNNTVEMLDYLKDMGVTTLYMLPFVDSPMEDAGFDVKNPQDVRQELGGMKQFEYFIKTAKDKGFNIKADLVLNHLSDKHEWFKKLQKGDIKYLDYFIWRDIMPEYKKYNDEKLGTVIEYMENNGEISKRRLIFPENTETNWRKVVIGAVNGKEEKTYYLYHTFYPFQLDINWENPEVLYYMLDTITKWANLGVDIFRMDAIPYLSKEVGTNAENQPKTHAIINILSNYIQLTAPSSVIQVEACQHPKDIIHYFGKTRKVNIKIDETDKELLRTSEAQIAYNFPYMNAIWASLVSEDKKYFINTYNKTPNIPKNTSWGVFLRVHDELTLEMVSPEIRNLIFEDLEPKGAGFRNGFGVSGRLANFLDKNPDRINLAFAIMFSTPGIPIIYYGDEVGVTNNFENAKKTALIRKNKNKFLKLISAFDSRDINRGPIPKKLFYGSQKGWYLFNSKVYNNTKHLLKVRKSLPVMADGNFDILRTSSNNCLSYIRKDKTQQVLVINNLSKNKIYTDISLPITMLLKNNKRITRIKNLITNENIKISISDNSIHILLHPYQVLWLDLGEGANDGE